MKKNLYMKRSADVIAERDVIVCGGGPAGIAAAIAAAKNNVKVTLLEAGSYLGGASTAARVSIFAYGFHDKKRYIVGGVFKEIRDRLFDADSIIKTKREGWEPYNPFNYKVLLDRLMEEYGVEVIFNAKVTDAVVKHNRIKEVVIPAKTGYKAFRAKLFVDATGDGDLGAMSGAPFRIGSEATGETQPMTMMYLIGGVDIEKLKAVLKRGYWTDEKNRRYLSATGFSEYIEKAKNAGEWNLPCDGIASVFTIPWMTGVVGINFGRVQGKSALDLIQLSQAETEGRRQMVHGINFLNKYIPGFESAYIVDGPERIGVRDTRRILGEYILTGDDVKGLRQFDDVIAQSCYMIDVHKAKGEGTYLYKLPAGEHHDIPYRSIVPLKTNNLLIAGRCISATQEAMGAIRVQPISMAVGEAAGTAAALCCLENTIPRKLNVGLLQNSLRKQNAILD